MVTSAPLVNAIANNALARRYLKSLISYAFVASDYAVNWIEVSAVQRPYIWKFMGATAICIIAFPDCRQRMVHRMSG